MADPAGIAMTFLDTVHRARLRIDSIMCVVDASQVFAVPEQEQLKLWQIACADMVVLNKTDLVAVDGVAGIRAWLDDRFHRYRLIEVAYGNVPLDLLLATGRFDPARWDVPADDTRGQSSPGSPSRCGRRRAGFHDVDVRDRRADVATSAPESGSPVARQYLPGQGNRLQCGEARCPCRAPGGGQTCGHGSWPSAGRTPAEHPDRGDRGGRRCR